jgi:hypothetical protein
MRQGEVKIFETDTVIFPVKTQQPAIEKDADAKAAGAAHQVQRIDVAERFARLKRNIRKRSAGIF